MVKYREDLIQKVVEMRTAGMTNKQIADELGYCYSYMSKIIASAGLKRKIELQCCYPGLKKYINSNFDTYKECVIHVFGSSNNVNFYKCKLNGKYKFSWNDIIKIMRASGKTFEYLFLMTEEQVDSCDFIFD